MAGLAAIEKGEMEDEHEKAEEDDAHANDQDDDGAVRTQDQLKAAGLEDSDAEDDMVAPSNKKWRAWSSDEDNDDEPSGRHHDLSPAGRKEDLAGSDPDDARDTEMRDEMHEPNMGTGDEDDD